MPSPDRVRARAFPSASPLSPARSTAPPVVRGAVPVAPQPASWWIARCDDCPPLPVSVCRTWVMFAMPRARASRILVTHGEQTGHQRFTVRLITSEQAVRLRGMPDADDVLRTLDRWLDGAA